MSEFADIIGLEPERFEDERVYLEEVDDKTGYRMRVYLSNLPDEYALFSYKTYNPNHAMHLSKKTVVFGNGRTASTRKFCDYLLLLKRAGKVCPVFLELGETSSSPSIGKKFEQLFSAQPVMGLYRSSYGYLLNGEDEIDAPRFVLIHAKERDKGLRSYPADVTLHRDYPRIVQHVPHSHAGFTVFYYGGTNKIIKIARTILKEEHPLDVATIFESLPEANPELDVQTSLQNSCRELLLQEATYC